MREDTLGAEIVSRIAIKPDAMAIGITARAATPRTGPAAGGERQAPLVDDLTSQAQPKFGGCQFVPAGG